jgi:hypothetical protein
MAKKPPKETPHLRIRIESRLLSKLEKSRERHGNTLTGEIVARLEESFETDARMAIFVNQWEIRISEVRKLSETLLAAQKKENSAVMEKLEWSEAKTEELLEQSQANEASEKMVNVLLGEDKQKSALLRRVALEIASWPQDWATNPSINKEIKERFRSTLATQVGEDAP